MRLEASALYFSPAKKLASRGWSYKGERSSLRRHVSVIAAKVVLQVRPFHIMCVTF